MAVAPPVVDVDSEKAEDRRGSGRRARATDRLMDRGSQALPRAPGLDDRRLENLLLFLDDDLREAGVALGAIEGYLLRALTLVERGPADSEIVARVAEDGQVFDHLEHLGETLESLRGRLLRLAVRLR